MNFVQSTMSNNYRLSALRFSLLSSSESFTVCALHKATKFILMHFSVGFELYPS